MEKVKEGSGMFQTWTSERDSVRIWTVASLLKETYYIKTQNVVGTLQSPLVEQRSHCAQGNIVLTLTFSGNN